MLWLHLQKGIRGRLVARVVLTVYLLISLGYPGVKFVGDVLITAPRRDALIGVWQLVAVDVDVAGQRQVDCRGNLFALHVRVHGALRGRARFK